MSTVILNPIKLIRSNDVLHGSLVFSKRRLEDLVLMRHEFLHLNEIDYFDTLVVAKRKQSYLLGRYAAKEGIASFVGEKDLSKIEISPGVFHQPIVYYQNTQNIQVSISHSDELGMAVVFPEAHPMAVDVEIVNSRNEKTEFFRFTDYEIQITNSTRFKCFEMATILWTVKEAMAKVIKTGLMANLDIYEIERINIENGCIESHFVNFKQYKCLSWLAFGAAWSIVLPKRTQLDIEQIIWSQSKLGAA